MLGRIFFCGIFFAEMLAFSEITCYIILRCQSMLYSSATVTYILYYIVCYIVFLDGLAFRSESSRKETNDE